MPDPLVTQTVYALLVGPGFFGPRPLSGVKCDSIARRTPIRHSSPRGTDGMDRLEALQLFVRVVEAGSLTKAARALGVVQPTVSKQISLLEEWLGRAPAQSYRARPERHGGRPGLLRIVRAPARGIRRGRRAHRTRSGSADRHDPGGVVGGIWPHVRTTEAARVLRALPGSRRRFQRIRALHQPDRRRHRRGRAHWTSVRLGACRATLAR